MDLSDDLTLMPHRMKDGGQHAGEEVAARAHLDGVRIGTADSSTPLVIPDDVERLDATVRRDWEFARSRLFKQAGGQNRE